MRWLICILLVSHALPVLAWSGEGHGALTEAAVELLSVPEQKYFNNRAERLINNDSAKKWRGSYKGLSPLAMAAIWPDTRRDQTVQTLFSRFAKSPVPLALSNYAGFNTNRWHFVNAQFWDIKTDTLNLAGQKSARCQTRQYGDLAKVWQPLIQAYSEVSSPAAEGLIIAFIAHLLEDAYQPLHSIASVNAQCENDAGGNKYCLEYGQNKRCKLNLHRLWDNGFGVFDSPINVSLSLVKKTPLDIHHAISRAAVVNASEAKFIYSAARNTPISNRYQAAAAKRVEQQRMEAVIALAQLLHQLYEIKHVNK